MADVEGERVFPRFPDLPKELRFKIWHYAGLNNPRLVITYMNQGDTTFRFTKTPVPTLFHVSHEARRESMRSYTATGDGKKTRSSQTIYINPSIDTVLIRVYIEHYSLKSQRSLLRRAMELNPSQAFDGVKGVGCMKVSASIYNDPDNRKRGWNLIFIMGKVEDNLDDLVEVYRKKYLNITGISCSWKEKIHARARARDHYPPQTSDVFRGWEKEFRLFVAEKWNRLL